jgi:hypothetical protein
MPKRDTLKTIAGLFIIALIVVATFMYGNAQRQAQLKRDQNNQKQAVRQTPSPTVSAKPSDKPGTSGTAAVGSPSPNAIQGGAKQTPAVQTTQGPSDGQVAGTTQTHTMPETGPGQSGMLAAVMLAGAVALWQRSRGWTLRAMRRRVS